MSDQHNPYGRAAAAYGNTASTADPRALEGQVLLKAAAHLEELSRRIKSGEKVPLEDISKAVDYNRKLWTVFASDTANPDHPLPKELKNNIASLAMFMFKTSIAVLVTPTPEKIQPMIDINRTIASGLMKVPKPPPPPAPADARKGAPLPQKQSTAPEKPTENPSGKKGSTDSLV